jgi:hypothetical protein
MKVDIRDKQVLDAIQPSVFAAYLEARGWQVRAESDAHSATFTHHEFEITLPLDAELRDFSIRMSEALRTLEVVEGRDQLAILSDLSPPERDASVENIEQAASKRSLTTVRAGNSVANIWMPLSMKRMKIVERHRGSKFLWPAGSANNPASFASS